MLLTQLLLTVLAVVVLMLMEEEQKPQKKTYCEMPTAVHAPNSTEDTLRDTELRMLQVVSDLVSGQVFRKMGNRGVFQAMGHIGEAPPQFHYYYAVARDNPWATTVCEVGFNAGHSFMAFMLGNPKISYISFDTGGLGWTEEMIAVMQEAFPGRLTYVKGESESTVAKYTGGEGGGSNFAGCDIVSADGLHHGLFSYMDMMDLRKISKKGAIVLLDDWSTQFPDVKASWERITVNEGIVQQIRCVVSGMSVGGYEKNWCHGFYNDAPFPPHPDNPHLKN